MKKTIALALTLIMLFALCPFSFAEEGKVDLCILKEADDNMINNYTLIAVDPKAPFTDADGNAVENVAINTAGAEALIEWMLSAEGNELEANYGVEDYGDALFYLKDGAPKYDGEIAKATEET